MNLLRRVLLFPISLLYCLIMIIRDWLYRREFFKSYRFNLPVISIGNITVGGTGKTPLTEYLIRLLSPRYKCALLSRGYRRKTKGVLMADKNATVDTIGDEPMQMKQKFSQLTVVVAEKRVKGMEHLLGLATPPEVVLLDDAFQHRSLTPGFSILVMDYHRPVYLDVCLPAGNLREPIRQAGRADILLVNKCPPEMKPDEQAYILNKLKPGGHQQVFFSSVCYEEPKRLLPLNHARSLGESVSMPGAAIVAVAGIGNPTPFFKELEKFNLPVTKISFPDHHAFSQSDLNRIEQNLLDKGPDALLITTEKDATRLLEMPLSDQLKGRIWYVPIRLKIMFNEEMKFNKILHQYAERN